MKQKLIFFILLALPIFCNAQTFYTTTTERAGYAEILPLNYGDTTRKFPVIIFLHGSGERGLGLTEIEIKKTIINGPAKYLKGSDFIILCPQTNAWSWRTKLPDGSYRNDANEFTKWALNNYRIDPKRVYITGLSMGGEGTWFAMAADPTIYAAGAPVCGRGSRIDGGNIAKSGIKVWAFHGDADTSIEFEGDWNAIGGFRAYNKTLNRPVNYNIRISIYEGVGHNCWDRAYRSDHIYHPVSMYEWFLKNPKP